MALVASLAVPASAATPQLGGIQALSAAAQLAYQPVVALDADGHATAFWNYSSTSRAGMKLADRAVGEGFAPPYSLASPGSNQVADPALDASPSGTTAAVWIDEISDHVVLLGAYRPAGGGWGDFQVIADSVSTDESFSSPHVSVSDSGRVVVAYWHYLSDGSHNIEGAISDTSGTFGLPQVLDNRMATESVGNFGPNAGIDAAGNAMMLWEGYDDASETTTVQYALANASSSSFGSPTELAQVHQDGIDPRLAVNPSGTALAVWKHTQEAADEFLNSARGTTTTGLTGLAPVPGGRPDWIDLSLDEDGNAIAARRGLIDGSVGNDVIQASVLAAGANTWGESQTLDSNADTDTSLETSDETLDVAMANGEGIVAWAREDPLDYMPAYIAALDASDRFGSRVRISSASAQVDRLRVDMNEAGDVVAVWRDDYRVYARGTWPPPARGRLTMTVNSRKQLAISGKLTPSNPGKKVAVTLYRKSGGRFKAIGSKNSTLTGSSVYNVSFQGPRPGTCKATARFGGDGVVQATSVSRTFNC